MRVPTKQLQEYSDRHNLNFSMVKLLQWLIRKCPGYSTTFLIDLNDFNEWQGKNRRKGKFSRVWLWELQNKLIELSIIEVDRSWRGGILKLSILSFNAGVKSCKNSKPSSSKVNKSDFAENRANEYSKRNTANQTQGKGVEQQQHIDSQHLKATFATLGKSGFKFDAKTVITKIAIHSAEAIALSIQYVQLKMARQRHKPIENPEGYVLDCLQLGYWKSLKGKDSGGYWSNVTRDLSSLLGILKEKLSQVDIEAYRGETADRLCQLIPLLEPGYYGEDIVASAIAWDEDLKLKKETRKTSRRRRGKGFGV